MTKFTLCILLLVLCATVPNVAVSARRVISTTSLSSLTTSNSLRRRGDALKNPSFDDKHTLISEEVVKDVRGGQGGGTATMSSEMFNMVKAVVGVGVLSLPAGKKFSITLTPQLFHCLFRISFFSFGNLYLFNLSGIAAFGDAPSAAIPAAFLIATIGIIAAYNFALLGRLCAITGASSYRTIWEKTIGDSTAWIPGTTVIIKTFFAILAYSMVLGDTFSALFQTLGMKVSREKALIGLTLTVLLPLCRLKSLASLAPFSLAGIAGMLYTAIAMSIRYLDGSYASPNSRLAMDVAKSLRPAIGNKGASAVFSSNAFILICMLSTAYMAHFNSPKFYLELENNTLARWNTVVYSSFSISILFFIGIAAMGFSTFGGMSLLAVVFLINL